MRNIQYHRFFNTKSGVSCFKQFKCPKGQTRLKQGLQDKPRETILTSVDKGGVNVGLVDPYTTTKGKFKAAAATSSLNH